MERGVKFLAPVSPSCSYDVMGGGVESFGVIYSRPPGEQHEGRSFSDVNTDKRWHAAALGLSLEEPV